MIILRARVGGGASLVAVATFVLVLTPSSSAAAYDGDKAAAYADKWATSRNTAYPTFGSDCTNFVSQALVAGGYSMVGKGTSETNLRVWWAQKNWYGSWDYAHTWSVAYDQVQFQLLHVPGGVNRGSVKGATAAYTPSLMTAGDILAYDWGGGTAVTHVSMQVGMGRDPNSTSYNGNLIDQHTTDRKRAIWHLRPYNPKWASTKIQFIDVLATNK